MANINLPYHEKVSAHISEVIKHIWAQKLTSLGAPTYPDAHVAREIYTSTPILGALELANTTQLRDNMVLLTMGSVEAARWLRECPEIAVCPRATRMKLHVIHYSKQKEALSVKLQHSITLFTTSSHIFLEHPDQLLQLSCCSS